ncbi:MAG: diphthamide biosynthesis enzyme Dph2 [Thermococci archaeon]|nr:diphthamide biosynthesis enzyme Dph2 [Thermococci archaeon]
MHVIDYEGIMKELRDLGATRVLIQSPEGLRKEAEALADFLEARGLEVILQGNVNYGACDPADHEAKLLGCDALVHLGHSKIPMALEVPTIFVPAFAEVDVVEALRKNMRDIRKLGERIGLVTTVQHVNSIERAISFLEGEGLRVIVGRGDSRVAWPGQVLGCNFSAARVDADGMLFVGSGYFHPVGLAITVKKPVLAVNPYSGDSFWVSEEAERLVRRRWAQIALAMDARRFGVITSSKKGQLRLAEARRVAELLRKNGREAKLIVMNTVSYPELEGFDFDAYVVVACPRIAIDDAENWRKPVLTPPEVELMLGLRDEYGFDEIQGVRRELQNR